MSAHTHRVPWLLRASTAVAACALAVSSCASQTARPASSGHTAADKAFVLDMLVHHERALQLGQLAAVRGHDQRVRAFGQRIVREQTPERTRLRSWVAELHLTPTPAQDSEMASGYVTDSQYSSLMSLTGTAFDRQVLLLSASSEDGAVRMATQELSAGTFEPARSLATSIAGAKTTESPQLRRLADQL